jgi:hypothetical protein
MTVFRWAAPIAAALVLTACSATDAPTPRPPASTSSSATTTAADSPFCEEMQALRAGLVVYRGDVLKAAQGAQELDVTGMRQRAVNIGYLGQSALADAPKDIAGQLQSVLDAIAASAQSMAQPGATVGDVYEPLFNDAITPAFDAVDGYDCATG